MRNLIKSVGHFCNKHEGLILFLLLNLLLRLPSFFAPHYYGDEEIYFVMGRAWRTGVSLYSGAFDHKPPLIYILAGITQSVFWFRVLLAGWMLVHTALFYKLSRLFWVRTLPAMAYLSTFIFVVLTSLPTFEGGIGNAELFMMLPLTAAILIAWRATDKQYLRWFMAGLVGGIGLLFKIPVLFDFLAIVIYLFALRKKTFREGIKSLITPSFWLFVIGFILPMAITTVYYFTKGTGMDYVKAALLINFGYISSWKTSSYAFNPFKSGLMVRAAVVALFTLAIYFLRNKLDKRFMLGFMWLTFSCFGAMLSSRPYPHYLLEPIVPFALFIPYIFVTEKALSWVVMAALLGWGVVSQKQIEFGAYPSIAVYQNYGKMMIKKITPDEYRDTFPGAKTNQLLSNYLNRRMTEQDGLYIWGTDATTYNLTNKLPAGGKYIVSFHVKDFEAFDEVMENIYKNKPKYIVVLPNPIPFAELTALLDNYYVAVTEIEGAQVYLHQVQY